MRSLRLELKSAFIGRQNGFPAFEPSKGSWNHEIHETHEIPEICEEQAFPMLRIRLYVCASVYSRVHLALRFHSFRLA